MEYYSAIKMNEVMPFAAAWMHLEIIILSEVSQTERQISYITHMRNLTLKKRKQMNLFTKQKRTYRYQKQTYSYQRGNVEGRDKSEAWDEHTHTTIYKTDNQQGPTV